MQRNILKAGLITLAVTFAASSAFAQGEGTRGGSAERQPPAAQPSSPSTPSTPMNEQTRRADPRGSEGREPMPGVATPPGSSSNAGTTPAQERQADPRGSQPRPNTGANR